MKKYLIFCITLILIFGITGCSEMQKHASDSTVSRQDVSVTDNVPSQSAVINESNTLPQQTVTSSQQGNVFNDDGSIRIDVYVNDELMDVKVFDDHGPRIEGPNNLGNYTLADPIMSFLGIEYEIDESKDLIRLSSSRYEQMDFSYNEDVKVIDGAVYLKFYDFRVYTNGSLKQNDYNSMYLYTGDYERTDLPTTLEECYAMLDETLSTEEILYLKNVTDEDLAMQHFGLGLWIRNNWLYPTQSKLAKHLLENGINHPDNMSSLILVGYVKYLNGKPCSLNDLLNEG